MEICFKEYDVMPDWSERHYEKIVIINSQVAKLAVHNNELVKGFIKQNKIMKVCEEYKDTILKLKNVRHENYKGGRQKELIIELNGEVLMFSGNTSNKEISEFYEEFKREIVEIING